MARIESQDSPLSAKSSVRSFAGSAGRTRLNDITNIVPHRQKTLLKPVSEEERLALAAPTVAKDYAKLLQENAALLKHLEERNGIIEYNNMEIQKFKVALQKLQQQNWQLAHSNSLILAELNIAKDRLKSLQHELCCSSAVLRTKTSEVEELKEKLKTTLATSKVGEGEPPTKGTPTIEDNSHPVAGKNPPSRKRASISQVCSSMGNGRSTDRDEDQRRSTRRRSSPSLKSQSSEPGISNLLEVEESVIEDQPLNIDPVFVTTACDKGKDEQEIKNPTSGKTVQKQAKIKMKHGRSVTKPQANEPVVANLDLQPSTTKLSEGKACQIQIRNLPGHRNGRKKEEGIMRRAAKRNCPRDKGHEASYQNPVIIEDSPTGQRDSSCSTSCPISESLAENVQSENVTASAIGEDDKHERKSLPEPVAKEAEPPAGRPSRRATIGISYKERPVNIKMRRPN